MKITKLFFTGAPMVWVVEFDDGTEIRAEGPWPREPDLPIHWTRAAVLGGHWLAPRTPGGRMIVDAADYPQHVKMAHEAVIAAAHNLDLEIM